MEYLKKAAVRPAQEAQACSRQVAEIIARVREKMCIRDRRTGGPDIRPQSSRKRRPGGCAPLFARGCGSVDQWT